jgi:hypothetical protein
MAFITVMDLHLLITIVIELLVIIGIDTGGGTLVPVIVPGFDRYAAIVVLVICLLFFCPLTFLVVIQN